MVKNIDLLISSNILSLDKTLTLDHQQLDDLTELLSGCGSVDNYNHWVERKPKWDIQNWISNNYITLHQFLQCEPYERRAYLCFMYCNPRPCDNFTLDAFLSLKPSTRKFISFNQQYLSPQEFDVLNAESQRSLNEILFSNMGLYAIDKNYISVEKFLSLSKNTQQALGRSIFYNKWDDRGGEGIKGEKHIDILFENNAFNWNEFSTLADQSINDAVDYLYDEQHYTRHLFF